MRQTGDPAELTLRAVVTGAAIGALLAVGNLYLGLKTGIGDTGHINAAIVGFALLAPIARLGARPFTPPENNLLVTVATAAAATPSAMGLLGAVPALAGLGAAPSAIVLLLWALAVGALGVLIAVALRGMWIEREALPFPTARATAEVIAAAHAQSGERAARGRALALLAGALVAMGITWLRDGSLWIPPFVALPAMLSALPPAAIVLGVLPSPVLLGSGALIGVRTAIDVCLGGALAWLLVAPALVRAGIAEPGFDPLVAWLLWPGVALMIGGSLTGVALDARRFRGLREDLRAVMRARSARAVPIALTVGAAVVIVGWLGLGLPPLLGVVAVLLALPLVAAIARAAAQTDVAHYAALGQAAQATLGVIHSGAPAANIAGAAVAAGSAPQTVTMLLNFRIASLVGGTPWRLVAAQLLGLLVGAVVAIPAYVLLSRAHGIGTAELPAPFAATWKAMALVTEKGLAALPLGAAWAGAAGLTVGVLATLARRAPWGRWVPMPVSVGIAFLVPGAVSLTLLAGALLAALVARIAPGWAERRVDAVAGGAIAGETIVGILVALLAVLR